MGFSSSLQGATSHDAILQRVDAELRLLENMKRCLTARVKADREYAIALNSFVLQSQKFDAQIQCGSYVAKSWSIFVEETEKMSKTVKESADNLANGILDKLNSLYVEKKSNRKQHQEEYGRNQAELNRLQDSVHRLRNDYERCLDSFMVSKAKYEDQYTKGKMGKRLDDCKERYHKATRKLHSTHNEYVLMLCEASEFERDLRTILLPGLLEYQQAIQEDMIDKWKLILRDAIDCCNRCSSSFQEMQGKIDDAVAAIRAADEYTIFADKYKTNPPEPVIFKFDDSLFEGYPSENLPESLSTRALSLNDQTVDHMKHRGKELESQLNECKAKIADKQTAIIQQETELATVKFKSDQISIQRMFTVKKTMDGLKKDVNELRCVEQKLSRQLELIQKPLAELGTDPVPNACTEVNSTGAMMNTMASTTSTGNNASSSGEENTAETKRRSLILSGATSGSGQVQMIGNMLKKPLNAAEKMMTNKLKAASSKLEIASSASSGERGGGGSGSGGGSQDTGLNNFTDKSNMKNIEQHQQQPPILPPSSGGNLLNGQQNPQDQSQTTNGQNNLLEENIWFHGVLPRLEVVRLLQEDGDFLVRETVRNEEKQIVLSVMWSSPKHFIVQTSPEGLYRFEGPGFNTVQELIMHQFHSGLAVTSRSGAVLKTPIAREDWELKNDDVQLVEKIGRGNFGDVYKANLRSNNKLATQSVAVKTCKVTLPEEQKKKFLQEGRILKQYDHANIVKFIGICVQKQPIMIVMELVPGGSLLNYLRNNGNSLNPKCLLGMCLDAAAGMQYLESKKLYPSRFGSQKLSSGREERCQNI